MVEFICTDCIGQSADEKGGSCDADFLIRGCVPACAEAVTGFQSVVSLLCWMLIVFEMFLHSCISATVRLLPARRPCQRMHHGAVRQCTVTSPFVKRDCAHPEPSSSAPSQVMAWSPVLPVSTAESYKRFAAVSRCVHA